MRAAEILNEIMALRLPLNKFYILGEAALVLYGIKEEAEEIQLAISVQLFNTLREGKRIDFLVTKDKRPYMLDGKSNVKVITKYKKDFECFKIGDLYIEDINKIYESKKKNKKENKKDIKKIEKFLKKYPNYPKF